VEVYGTNTFIESVPLPKPLPSKGTLRLRLERVGLVAGNYNLDVRAHSQGGTEYDVHRDIYRFTVQSSVPDTGFARPPHRWILEEGQDTAQGQDATPAKPAEDRLAS
jgi:lipopolysaccharide transport system ATP-binding protein